MARKKKTTSTKKRDYPPLDDIEVVDEKPIETVKKKTLDEKLDAEAICPTCGKPVETHKCRLCGATKSINAASGNVIWMRNGRVVAAFQDSKTAYVNMATRHGIPRDEWPEQFKK